MAINLKGRLEKLEAAAPASSAHYCLVVHRGGVNCSQTRAEAIAAYVEQHGHEPASDRFINIHLICPETKRSACDCKSEPITEAV